MAECLELPRVRSDSSSSSTSQSTTGRLMLRQRLSQLLTCVEDLSSDEETNEEVSRTLDEAFNLCGRWTNKEFLRLHMVTWNVATAEPPRDVTSLLRLDSQTATDLYVIGLQEVSATPVRYISDLIVEDSWSHLLMDTLAPKGYVKVTSVRMQGLLILLFAKQAHVPYIRNVQTTYTRTGIYGFWGNKGGVSIRFSFYGHMLCFLNCHLAAHMNYALQRVDEFEYILDTQDFDVNNTPNVLDHKVVFWFGDLNFRIADHGMHFLRSSIEGGRFNLLWTKDQLTVMKKKEPLLQEFEEGPLQFKPTYKFDRNSDTYDSSFQKTWFGFNGKKRKPAWTDRILWRIRPKTDDDEGSSRTSLLVDDDEEYPLKVAQDVYTSNMEYGISDHKPVIGIFTLEMRKKFERPLVTVEAEGLWSADENVLVSYTIQEAFPASTYDWIGLYKTDFKSPHDYVAFTWAKDYEVPVNDLVKVCMKGDDLPLLSGHYILGYYSTNMQSIVGLSRTFQIQESKQAVLEGLVPENINGLDK
ncbi:inositol polyphosphate 5-phosphatase K isoform X1 [Alosa sapidissima]|uniref:inositol polyphosphate 5-phosphatase K isoform X1 n=1 Tax=Alosa sapidissima TaxID=34773 RepID=UPI001C09F26F|nr:inositol polyphosphate 5-phosphatase K isoform X1 [Alosa sapidissima]